MSYTTIKAIWPGERVESVGELHNAWGSAPFIWDAICKRYLGGNWISNSEKLWPLWEDQKLPLHQRAVLAMTYDRMYLVRADYARASADIRRFLEDFTGAVDRANHWPAIAELLESNPDYPAIGFHMTSVADDPWRGPYDEEIDEYEPIDWSKAWSLYEYLDAQVREGADHD